MVTHDFIQRDTKNDECHYVRSVAWPTDMEESMTQAREYVCCDDMGELQPEFNALDVVDMMGPIVRVFTF